MIDITSEKKLSYAVKMNDRLKEILGIMSINPPYYLIFDEEEKEAAISQANQAGSVVYKVEQTITTTYSSLEDQSIKEVC